MAATILDGKALAGKVRAEIEQRVRALNDAGRPVRLVAVLVGATPAAEMYAARQGEGCRAAGIEYELRKLPPEASRSQLIETLESLNQDQAVTGIMLLQPLPPHLDAQGFQQYIHPRKDVEGISPASLGLLLAGHPLNIPCTALAAFRLVQASGVPIRGATAVVVGASEIVGKPVALLLSDQRATVTIARSATRDLAEVCQRADILVAAVGKPGLIGAAHVRPGAVVVDVGINRVTLPDGKQKTVGDVDFDAVKDTAGFITPVPGGVGPVTVAMLLSNTLDSAEAMAAVGPDDDRR